MNTAPLRVLIADDFAPIRRRLTDMLADEADVTVVGEAASVAGTLEAISNLAPDVVILGLIMPDGHGIDVLRLTLAQEARPYFIVLSQDNSEEYRMAAAHYQAHAFINKASELAGVIASLYSLAQNTRHGARLAPGDWHE